MADPYGAAHRVHCAWHPVRELRPSDYDSFNPSFSGVGAILALLAFQMEFSIIALIGVILLIGIVKKNAIMMIDFALDAERNKMPPEQAIYQACVRRFRPIMMTTMAALLGAVRRNPHALVKGRVAPSAGRFYRRRPDL